MAKSKTTTQLLQELDQQLAKTDEELMRWVADYKTKAEQVGETKAVVDLIMVFNAMDELGHGPGTCALLAEAIKLLSRKEESNG
jgi:hypothetical protein